jgi:hypothetical protein
LCLALISGKDHLQHTVLPLLLNGQSSHRIPGSPSHPVSLAFDDAVYHGACLPLLGLLEVCEYLGEHLFDFDHGALLGQASNKLADPPELLLVTHGGTAHYQGFEFALQVPEAAMNDMKELVPGGLGAREGEGLLGLPRKGNQPVEGARETQVDVLHLGTREGVRWVACEGHYPSQEVSDATDAEGRSSLVCREVLKQG